MNSSGRHSEPTKTLSGGITGSGSAQKLGPLRRSRELAESHAAKRLEEESSATRQPIVGYRQSVIEEFGDVLWVLLSNISARASLNLSDLARKLPRDLNDWAPRQGPHAFVTFADLQHSFHASADPPTELGVRATAH